MSHIYECFAKDKKPNFQWGKISMGKNFNGEKFKWGKICMGKNLCLETFFVNLILD